MAAQDEQPPLGGHVGLIVVALFRSAHPGEDLALVVADGHGVLDSFLPVGVPTTPRALLAAWLVQAARFPSVSPPLPKSSQPGSIDNAPHSFRTVLGRGRP